VKLAVPKLASANGVQEPDPSHEDGASAIHSALDVSGFCIWRVLVADCPEVWSDRDTVTAVPLTSTLAET